MIFDSFLMSTWIWKVYCKYMVQNLVGKVKELGHCMFMIYLLNCVSLSISQSNQNFLGVIQHFYIQFTLLIQCLANIYKIISTINKDLCDIMWNKSPLRFPLCNYVYYVALQSLFQTFANFFLIFAEFETPCQYHVVISMSHNDILHQISCNTYPFIIMK